MIKDKRKFKKFIKNLITRSKDHDLTTMASSLSYYYLSAAIPILLVLVNIISKYMAGNNHILISLMDILPTSIRDLFEDIIKNLIRTTNNRAISSFTILFALWSGSKGVQRLLLSINKAYGLEEENTLIKNKIIGFIYTFIMVAFLIILMFLNVYAKQIFHLVDKFFKAIHPDINILKYRGLVSFLKFIIPIIFAILTLTLLYKSAPFNDSYKVNFKEALIGSISTSIIIIVVSLAYSFFLDNLSNMSLIYGALAGFIALFVWILLFSIAMILGAEIIAAFREIYSKDHFIIR